MMVGCGLKWYVLFEVIPNESLDSASVSVKMSLNKHTLRVFLHALNEGLNKKRCNQIPVKIKNLRANFSSKMSKLFG